MRSGFTLIELLIVIAIILILISIALPNFMEAQLRAKVARMKAEIRTLAIAVEGYRSDRNHYPPHRYADGSEIPYPDRYVPLTTPIPYLLRLPGRDVFYWDPIEGQGGSLEWISWTNFACFPETHALYPAQWTHRYMLRSRGPDTVNESNDVRNAFMILGPEAAPSMCYSPTNGSTSQGDILRTLKVFP
jgi:prepilin-type N-terminal cleavage/methylation domain-containing protein